MNSLVLKLILKTYGADQQIIFKSTIAKSVKKQNIYRKQWYTEEKIGKNLNFTLNPQLLKSTKTKCSSIFAYMKLKYF